MTTEARVFDEGVPLQPTDKVLDALVGRINALSPPQRLRLAAALLEEGKGRVAHPIVKKIADELGLAIFLADESKDREARGPR